MRRPSHAVALVGCLALASAMGFVPDARAQATPTAPSAQQQMQNPADLPPRRAIFAWDHDLLRASFSARDILDKAITEKLTSGLRNDLVTRAYVFEEGSAQPVALAARTCSVRWELWDELFYVYAPDPAGGERKDVVANLEGVIRKCIDGRDFPIVDRKLLKPGKVHFLGVIVEVNPISEEMMKQLRQQITRPTSAAAPGAGDAIFGSFVGLFVRQIGKADATLVFRTQQTFVP